MSRNGMWIAMAVAALFSTQVLAQMAPQTAPGKTREQVRKECIEARKAGKVQDGECAPDAPPGKAPSTTTRAQVTKECIEARKAGKIQDGECAPDAPAGKASSVTTRAAAKKEGVEARKAGTTADGTAKP